MPRIDKLKHGASEIDFEHCIVEWNKDGIEFQDDADDTHVFMSWKEFRELEDSLVDEPK